MSSTGPRDAPPVLDTDATRRIFAPENLNRLVNLVRPHLEADRRKLVYVFPASGRFAHLALEPHALHTLYGDTCDEILVVIHDRRIMPVSAGLFDTVSQHVRFIETRDRKVVQLGHYDGGEMGGGPMRLLLASPTTMLQQVQKRHAETPPPHFKPPEALMRRGEAWLDRLGIAPDEPIVTLHVRDAGFLAGLAYHSYRAATLANTHAAIDTLAGRGFRVFRLGDRGGPRLERRHDRVVDVPFLEDYADWMDVFLIARSRFLMCCSSGPEGVARVLGTPMLMVNTYAQPIIWLNPHDLLMFKRYRLDADGRFLSYREALDRGLAWLTRTEEFVERGVSLVENTPEELAAAAAEMADRLDGRFAADPGLDDRFLAIGRAFADRVRAAPPREGPWSDPLVDSYGMASPLARHCHAFSRMHPEFLDD